MAQMTLKAARVNVGLSQKIVAEVLEVAQKTVGNWERGVSVPSADKIDALCKLYCVTYDDINFYPQIPFKGSLEELKRRLK